MQPRVSIVIPVFNDHKYLALAIESVLAQDYENVELIVVDDGSTDGSGAIADGYADRCIVLHQTNAGQSAALEAGWDQASGSLLGYLSSDDLLRPTAVRTLVKWLSESQAILAYPDFGIIDARGETRHVVAPAEFARATLYGELRCLPGPGVLFRRSGYSVAGPWRRDMRQIPDLEFYLRLGLVGDFVHVPEILADFRLHAESTTYMPVPVDRADEPIKAVSLLLARDLPDEVTQLRRRMRTRAHYLSGVLHAQSGRRGRAFEHVLAAAIGDPKSVFSRGAIACFVTILRGAPALT